MALFSSLITAAAGGGGGGERNVDSGLRDKIKCMRRRRRTFVEVRFDVVVVSIEVRSSEFDEC